MEQLSQFVISHWAQCLALVFVLILIVINELQDLRKKGKQLSPQGLVAMINNENAVVIDLRDAESYRKAHIIDAIRATNEDFEQNRMDKYKDRPIILVCPRGTESSTLAAKLQPLGFTQPMILSGGMSAWIAADLPVVKGK